MPHWIAPYARTAFATGWAASGGPMTERVKAASIAAVELAIEHADEGDVIEATLQFGHLEGVWAAIFDRREKLYAAQSDQLLAAWNALIVSVDFADAVRAARQTVGLTEAVADTQNPDQDRTAEVIAALLLVLLQRRVGTPQWQALRSAIIGAMQAGLAEGEANSLAIAASYRNTDGTFNFDMAAQDALDRISTEIDMIGGADVWLNRLVTDLATSVSRQLLKMARAGVDSNTMLASILDGSLFKRVIGWFVDNVVHLSITQGILGFYRRSDVAQVWYITAGDNAVCATCDAAEAGSPYELNSAPQPPLHPSCRCSIYTTDDVPPALVDGYL